MNNYPYIKNDFLVVDTEKSIFYYGKLTDKELIMCPTIRSSRSLQITYHQNLPISYVILVPEEYIKRGTRGIRVFYNDKEYYMSYIEIVMYSSKMKIKDITHYTISLSMFTRI